ncbi:SNARE domain protein [Mycena sanguinolenta]|uniref:SNARE domain protein n=1 Tax=Mycena sanguinolenta TaxID=230812 RepID=A0A8H7CQJ9_9AGAR|nr:SNARE domain protein [Mycena sanguinolenta]
MSVDPYHAVQREISNSLQAATQLRASYLRIRNMVRGDNEELVWARNEASLKATLAALEADLEDLDESVKIVESTDARMFGLDDMEVQERRRYVVHVRREIDNMRAEVTSSVSRAASRPHSPFPEAVPSVEDDQSAWAREEQQVVNDSRTRPDDGVYSWDVEYSGTTSRVNGTGNCRSIMSAPSASYRGFVDLWYRLLDDLERGVDRTDTKLSGAMERMRKFLRQSEEKGSGWCIIFLIIVLTVLLLLIIIL